MKIKKEKKQKPKYVRICPNCGSLDVEILNITKQYTFAFGLPTAYKCRSCGFSSHVFPEVSEEELNRVNVANRKEKGFGAKAQRCKTI